MEQAIFDSNLGWYIGVIVVYLFLSILMSALFRFIPKTWKHHNKLWRPFGTKSATYFSGIVIWIATSIAIACFISVYISVKPEAVPSPVLHAWLLLVPFIGLLFYLAWNWVLSFEKAKGTEPIKYDQEVELIKFVERHANYMILGITGMFIAAQFWGKGISVRFSMFYLFMILSMAYSVCGVLPLIWIPKGDAEHLEWLRNFKTVWYGYAIYLFFAGILSLAIAIL